MLRVVWNVGNAGTDTKASVSIESRVKFAEHAAAVTRGIKKIHGNSRAADAALDGG